MSLPLVQRAWGQAADLTKRVIPKSEEPLPLVGLGTWITFNVGDDPVLMDECAAVIAAFFEG
ncbi:aldo/keto reductase, partial [Sinorhizobium meliloti]